MAPAVRSAFQNRCSDAMITTDTAEPLPTSCTNTMDNAGVCPKPTLRQNGPAVNKKGFPTTSQSAGGYRGQLDLSAVLRWSADPAFVLPILGQSADPQELDATDPHTENPRPGFTRRTKVPMQRSCRSVRTQTRWRTLEPSRALVAGSRSGRPRQRSRSTDSASIQTAHRHSYSRLPGRNSRR